MEEDFQECDVIWPEHHYRTAVSDVKDREMIVPPQQNRRVARNKKQQQKKNSLPVNVPEDVAGRSWFNYADLDDFDDGEMVPPHLLLARRIAGKMDFSVCTGNGRTLKGRDLSQVRNSILRLTGFLES
ncbi:hypothetical protein HHK36_001636 [Tetracentron sinense]|uniref:Senescence regulator n=1 Tax=Tetracentron sinense TaxID=13715 RepID=A0A835DUW2_TETSI|nr:hypothetical protein HHK36_001636 [Tetracentron sinense]